MKVMYIFLILTVFVLIFGGMWNSVPAIKNTVHAILDPTFGALIGWNAYFGMFLVILILTLITTLCQKYLTDQASLKQIKVEQKQLQEEAKKYRDNPGKMMELNKKQMEFIPKTFELSMKPLIFTFIPFVLFFRWFNDYFTVNSFKFFGFLSWFWVYLIFSIVFSSILRKILKVH